MRYRSSLLVVLTIMLAGSILAMSPSSALAQGTPGYWKNHSTAGTNQYNTTWDEVGGPGASFLGTDKTWLDVLTDPAHGRAYSILARQYAAAALNVRAEAFATIRSLSYSEISEAGVVRLVNAAETMLRGANTLAVRTTEESPATPRPTREDFITLAGDLDRYNNMVAIARDQAELGTGSDGPVKTSWGDLKARFEK